MAPVKRASISGGISPLQIHLDRSIPRDHSFLSLADFLPEFMALFSPTHILLKAKYFHFIDKYRCHASLFYLFENDSIRLSGNHKGFSPFHEWTACHILFIHFSPTRILRAMREQSDD